MTSKSPAKKTSGNPDALRESRQRASAEKQASALQAVQDLLREGTVVSVSEVATRAKVSRDFLYRHKDILSVVESAMQTQRESDVEAQRAPRHTPVALASLQADLASANQEIKRLREENSTLKTDLKLDLGAQVEAQDREVASQTLVDKTREVNRLVSENHQLKRQVTALTQERDQLEEELTAERRAKIALVNEDNVRQLHK